jgi:hypothetical protein
MWPAEDGQNVRASKTLGGIADLAGIRNLKSKVRAITRAACQCSYTVTLKAVRVRAALVRLQYSSPLYLCILSPIRQCLPYPLR